MLALWGAFKTGFLNREGAGSGKQCVFVVKLKASIYLLAT
jgi:hypothetical protein